MMLKHTALLIFSLLSIHAQASDCTYDFDQDTKCDSYTTAPLDSPEGLNLVTISLGNKEHISGIFNTGSAGIALGYLPGEITVPLNFYSPRTVLQSSYTFHWKDSLKNWVLTKESNWSEPYRDEIYSLGGEPIPEEARFPTDFEVKRIKCCVLLSDFKEQAPTYDTLNSDQNIASIDEDIDYLKTALKSGKESPLFYKNMPANENNRKPIPADFIYELRTALTAQNVEILNNYAFYMHQTGSNILAITLLRSIYEKFPQRIVTKINLADSYWEIGSKDKACPLYNEYIRDMKSAGKQSLIPNITYARSDCSAYSKDN